MPSLVRAEKRRQFERLRCRYVVWYARGVQCLVLGLVLALLGGCAETAARFFQQGVYLHEAAAAYVREVHAFRQWVRVECKASLVREIDTLKDAGDEPALRALLTKNYPGLVTFDIIDAARDDPTGILAAAPGCEPPPPKSVKG